MHLEINTQNVWFYCLDANNGSILWNYTAVGENYHQVMAFFCSVADNKVYFGISNSWIGYRFVYCIDALDGGFIWKYRVGNDVISTPTIADEKLYVTSYDGNIYCFGN